jgi:hypothetical protein
MKCGERKPLLRFRAKIQEPDYGKAAGYSISRKFSHSKTRHEQQS